MFKMYAEQSQRFTSKTRITALIAAVLGLLFFAPSQSWASKNLSLAWNPESSAIAAGYVLYVGTTSGKYTTRLDVGTNTATTVSGLSSGVRYYFAVTAYNAARVESAPSAEISYHVPGGRNATLAWNAVSSTNVTGYALYSGTNVSNYSTRLDVGTNTAGTVSGLNEGLTYYFSVTSYNAAGVESAPSAPIAYLVPGILTLTPASKSGTPMMVKFPVAPGHSYTVQGSADMQSWVNLWQTGTVTSNAWVSFQDSQSKSFPKRFYRLTTP